VELDEARRRERRKGFIGGEKCVNNVKFYDLRHPTVTFPHLFGGFSVRKVTSE
jgi:uncharacterized protein (DUF952 family)